MLKILSSVQSFIKDSWESHMICFIITGVLLIIPDSWFISAVGYSIPNYLQLIILILFILSSILICFDLIICNSKKQLDKYNYRVKQIKEWKAFIEQFDFKKNNFGNTTIYASMRPHMSEETIKDFEAKRTYYVCSNTGRGANLFKQWMSDEVSAIERKWKLI